MPAKFKQYPLVHQALKEITDLREKAGLNDSGYWDNPRMMEILDTCLDRPAAEKENVIATAVIIMGTPGTIHDKDATPYLDKYNPQIYSLIREFQNGINETSGSTASKESLQIIAAHQIGVYEYYLDAARQASPQELAASKWVEKLDRVYNNNRFELEPPKGVDLGAPKLKALAHSVLSDLRTVLGVPDNSSAPPRAPRPPKP